MHQVKSIAHVLLCAKWQAHTYKNIQIKSYKSLLQQFCFHHQKAKSEDLLPKIITKISICLGNYYLE